MEKKYTETSLKILKSARGLYEDKNIMDITVTDICNASGINRSTFYEYFKSVDEVNHEIIYQIVSEFHKKIPQRALKTEKGITDFFSEVDKNRGFFRNFYKKNHEIDFSTELQFWNESLNERNKYYFMFVNHSMNGILKYWMLEDKERTPEEIASIYIKYILR